MVAGLQIQIQIQSSMFPFIDINPQHYVDNIFEAKESDYVKAMHTIYHNKDYPSAIRFKTLDNWSQCATRSASFSASDPHLYACIKVYCKTQ